MVQRDHRFQIAFLILAFTLIPCLGAFAADEGERPGLVQPMLPTWVWSVIIFAAVVFFLRAKAWGPIIKALDEREVKIKKSLEAADRALEESREREKEHEEVMAQARRDATEIVEEGKRDAVTVKEGILTDAKSEAAEITRRAKAEIARAKNLAVDEIHQHAVSLSLAIAEKVVRRSLTPQDHEQLVRETIAEYEKTNGSGSTHEPSARPAAASGS